MNQRLVIAIADRAHRDLDPGLGAAFPNSTAVNWPPWSEWWISPAVGATSGERHLER